MGWTHTEDQIAALQKINALERNTLDRLSDAPEIRTAVQALRDAVSAYGDPSRQPAGRDQVLD